MTDPSTDDGPGVTFGQVRIVLELTFGLGAVLYGVALVAGLVTADLPGVVYLVAGAALFAAGIYRLRRDRGA